MAGGSTKRTYVRLADGTFAEVGYMSDNVPFPVSVVDGICINANIGELIVEEPREVQAQSVDGLTVTQNVPFEVRDTSNPPIQVSGGTLQGISDTVTISGTVTAEISEPVQVRDTSNPPTQISGGRLDGISDSLRLEQPIAIQAATANGITVFGLAGGVQDVQAASSEGLTVNITQSVETRDTSNPPVQISGGYLDGISTLSFDEVQRIVESVPVQAATAAGLTITGTVTAQVSEPLEIRDLSNPPVQISGGTLQGISDAITITQPIAVQAATAAGLTVSLAQPITVEEPREVQAASLTGLTITGQVQAAEEISAFGELVTVEPTQGISLLFPYGVLSTLVGSSTIGAGTITSSDGLAILQTGASASSRAGITSNKTIRYNPGEGVLVRFTAVFTAGATGSVQRIGIGDSTDGLFFGYQDTTFGVFRIQNGSTTFTAQSSWNGDKADGTGTLPVIDFTKGNVFQLRFQWLGFGACSFWCENPSTGTFTLLHRIPYANTATVPIIYNPTLPLSAFSINSSNISNITLKTGSLGAYSEGKGSERGVRFAVDVAKTGISTEQNVLTIRNRSTFLGKVNRVPVFLDFLSTDNVGNKNIIIRAKFNATLGGTPSYTNVNTNLSVVGYDTAGTTVTGGILGVVIYMAKNLPDRISLREFKLKLYPGNSVTLSAESASANNVNLALSWEELF